MPAPLTTLLLLADGRLPAGGHAHSGGLEAAVAAGRVRDADDLTEFLRGRLATAGLVAAAFTAAACTAPAEAVPLLDAELDARTPSPALRRASRQQGRAVLRAGRAIWSLPGQPAQAHQPVALGLVAAMAGLDALQAATIAAYGSVSGPSSAAVRLLGLDPYRAYAIVAGLAEACDDIAARAAAAAYGPIEHLPSAGAPLLDISAEVHASWEVRLFAS
ncbi:MAG TPA: urease accessory UreF family protein [Micromonosporaceae bacterium]|nr:urease accessory UreF family protein [Micromonosporaceae bacterium]